MKVNMKKLVYASLAVAMSVSFAGCEDAITSETQSSLDSSVVFSNLEYAEAAVMGIHVSFAETNSYRGRYIPYYGMNTDAEWYNSLDKYTDDKARLCNYNTDVSSSQMNTDNNAWAKMYEAIERANKAIEGLREYAGDDEDLLQLLGEAITLRAMVYVDLVKAWRDVPFRFEPNTSDNIYLAKSPCDEIYIQLLSDLEEAQEYCAWPNETDATTSVERVSKAFVKGLRARVALYAAGYCQRADGNISLSSYSELDQTTMYEIAKKECVEVIESGTCALASTFEEIFQNYSQDIVTAGSESIFEIPFADGRGRVCYTFGVQHNAIDKYTGQAQGGTNGPDPTLFYDYDVDDARRDVTCVPYEWDLQTGETAGESAEVYQNLRNSAKWCFGKFRYEWMTRRVTSSNDDGINWPVLRMADIYLMAAEAINELEGPSAAAQYMEPIVSRALPSDKATAYMSEATASKDAFFNAIVDQRRFEFAGEQLRKMDLIRWNLLGDKLDETVEKNTQLQNREGDYSDLPRKLYYAYDDDDPETILLYGLNHGEVDTTNVESYLGSNYSSTTWLSLTSSRQEKIDGIFVNDPDKYQFWPIWQVFIDASNGMLENDDWYK